MLARILNLLEVTDRHGTQSGVFNMPGLVQDSFAASRDEIA
jgi:hypothetical protein